MRQSSSPSDRLLGGVSGAPDVDTELSDRSLLQAMLDAEAALARATADVGILPPPAAEAIVEQCRADRYDPGALGRAADAAGNPVVALVGELTAAVPEHARGWVHFGATSQDVLDTALVLVSVRALDPLLRHLDAAVDAAARLADTHRDTVLVARTLGQQAAPTTFGLKAAGWLTGLVEARDRLRQAGAAQPAQLGGAVGTLAAFGPAGTEAVERFAAHLGLPSSPLPWHTRRQPWLDLAAALGGLLVSTGKVALDVGLLAQNDVGEVAEGGTGRGRSSAMPHKRNPVDSILVTAAARRGPGLVATVFAAAVQEHERAAGAWHAEWEPLLDLLHVAGGAAARCARMLVGLQVHPARMRENLDATGGLVLAEAVAARLAPVVGRGVAHDLVTRAAAGASFRAALLADPAIRAHLSEAAIDEALDPYRWLGSAHRFVDTALATVRGADR
ncbi:3-carboxy-cis,cis-muconate cycloisomerase [Micromonospora chokoriensis]|uniref:3-carboxy-cis,cis-muconate cycloisomerase n=1 Tax=Micromonospora chokoriensis TaxID=356851 RepID=A0A1C4YNK8_9ACTN|nr:3-carboxy-cis,cis-muconate cycloisomerase [Micromonospora chokoriensis]SCF22228.1 3-carboxy-cis,cis-muconate cycloisomerase [Micromonospora chokoriensis]